MAYNLVTTASALIVIGDEFPQLYQGNSSPSDFIPFQG